MAEDRAIATEAALRARAAVLADKIALDVDIDPDDVVALATDLIVGGFDGDAVVRLASFRRRSRWVDVEEAAREALEAVGTPVPPRDAAGWVLARHWAQRLSEGGPETYRCAAALWGLWWHLGNPDEIGALVEAMDAWEETLEASEARDQVEADLALLATPIIAAAARRLDGSSTP